MTTTTTTTPSAAPSTAKTPRAGTSKNLRLINGNCIEVLQHFDANSIDFVLTDPPYLVNYRDRTGRSIQGDQESDWLRPAFEQIARVLKCGGYCISFYGWNHVEKFMLAWKSVGLRPVGQLVFAKGYSSKDSVLRSTHEAAYILAKGTPREPNFLLNSVQPWSYTGNAHHPTEKPVSSMTPLIAAFSNPGDIVLDPFMGSGSTGKAALELDRRFVGVEVDPTYYETAKKRLLPESEKAKERRP